MTQIPERHPGACSCDCVAAVRFTGVSIDYGGVKALENVTAHAPKGGCTAIVGPNGAGKTSLMLALLGELSYRGSIETSGAREGEAPRFGYVPQKLSFDRSMPLTVMEFLVSGIQRSPVWFGVSRMHRAACTGLLAELGCESLADRSLGALSGGELQRVLLALALQREPDILILDEPASGVDMKGGQICCMILDRFRKERGFTQVMVSHDLGTVRAHATHVICLNRRVYAEGPPEDVMGAGTLAMTFGLHSGEMPWDADACCGKGGCDA